MRYRNSHVEKDLRSFLRKITSKGIRSIKMKMSSIIVISLIISCVLIYSPAQSFGESGDILRWDLFMIKEAPIWNNLLVDYPLADHKKFWPERKKALEKVVTEYPNSRWADDAALMLACGKASFEGDKTGAIADLKKIASKSSSGQTIVTSWSPDGGCRIDEIWLMWQGGLVFLNPNGSVRISKPFDKDGSISSLQKEALSYFAHVDKYPVTTKITAQLFSAEMMESMGDRAGTVSMLEDIASNAESYLSLLSRADKAAASQQYGYHIRSLVRRPEYRAFLSLIKYYEMQHETDKATKRADLLVSLSSPDGWLWNVNKQIGDLYDRIGKRGKAEEQYKLALSGLKSFSMDEESRRKQVGGTNLPVNYFESLRRDIEKNVSKESR